MDSVSSPQVVPAPRPAPTVSIPVLLGGIATTVLTVVLSYWLSTRFGFDAMGFYGWYVVPIGPILVGLLAGSGYGIVSRLTGFRIQKRTLWMLVGLQVLAYVAAQYAEYLSLRSAAGAFPAFLPYVDLSTRAISFSSDTGPAGQPLGALGYGVRLLDIVGVVGGALLIPAGMRAAAYCDDCGRYMTSRSLGILPASVQARRTWGTSAEEKAAYEAEQATAQAQGQAVHDHLFALAEAGSATDVAEAVHLMKAGTRDAGNLPTRLQVHLASCPACRRGVLSSQVLSGRGRGQTTAALASVPVAPDVVRALDA